MKLERHSKIVELIGKYEIETQEELAEHLKEEGYQVTQATISRDIRELKLTKASGENRRAATASKRRTAEDFSSATDGLPSVSVLMSSLFAVSDNVLLHRRFSQRRRGMTVPRNS